MVVAESDTALAAVMPAENAVSVELAQATVAEHGLA
jgi:hypothetical protein